MTEQEEDAILCLAIIEEVRKCVDGKNDTTTLVEKVHDIIDCGKALTIQRKRKEDGKL